MYTKQEEDSKKLIPKKQFGQNFLINGSVQQKISSQLQELIRLYPDIEFILEIGPGQGDMTQHLLDTKLPLIALELDKDSIKVLRNKHFDEKMTIVHADALDLIAQNKTKFINYLLSHQQFQVIKRDTLEKDFILFSSLPYNVGSRIIIDYAINFSHQPFLVILQKEVVNKINISKKLTVFGLFLNLIYNLKHIFDISPGNFHPAPKVTSALLEGKTIELPEWLNTIEKRKKALETLKKIMAFPNKTLANNLKNLEWNKQQIDAFLAKNNLDVNYRLEVNNFKTILEQLISSDN